PVRRVSLALQESAHVPRSKGGQCESLLVSHTTPVDGLHRASKLLTHSMARLEQVPATFEAEWFRQGDSEPGCRVRHAGKKGSLEAGRAAQGSRMHVARACLWIFLPQHFPLEADGARGARVSRSGFQRRGSCATRARTRGQTLQQPVLAFAKRRLFRLA